MEVCEISMLGVWGVWTTKRTKGREGCEGREQAPCFEHREIAGESELGRSALLSPPNRAIMIQEL